MRKVPAPAFDGIPVSLFFDLTVAEDAAPVGYHADDTPCYAFKGRCPKGGIARSPNGSPVLDLSVPESLAVFKEYVASIVPATMPARLLDGSPKSAMRWFEENMVGKSFAFDIPGFGARKFHVQVGHLFRLVCETPEQGIKKGMVSGAKDAEDARRLIREGKVKASDCAGWSESRARSLPLVPFVLSSPDAVLRERDRPGFLTFIKKFISVSGGVNTIVFRLNEDGETLGPMSAHVKGLTDTWLKKQDLTAVPATRSLGTSQDVSAPDKEIHRVACAESNSRLHDNIVANRRGEVNGVGQDSFDRRAFARYLANS